MNQPSSQRPSQDITRTARSSSRANEGPASVDALPDSSQNPDTQESISPSERARGRLLTRAAGNDLIILNSPPLTRKPLTLGEEATRPTEESLVYSRNQSLSSNGGSGQSRTRKSRSPAAEENLRKGAQPKKRRKGLDNNEEEGFSSYEPSYDRGASEESGDSDVEDQTEPLESNENDMPGRKYLTVEDHELGAGIIILPELRALVCRQCQFVIKGKTLYRHFQERPDHVIDFRRKDIDLVIQRFDIPPISVPPPPRPGCAPISCLQLLRKNKCGGCGMMIPTGEREFDRHQCPNKASLVEASYCVWVKHSRNKPLLFEVSSDTQAQTRETVAEWGRRKYAEFSGSMFTSNVGSAPKKAAVHPFLTRTGFLSFLNPLSLAQLETLKSTTKLPPPDDPMRHLMRVVLEKMLNKLHQPKYYDIQHILNHATGETISHSVRTESHTLTPQTINRYADEATRLITFLDTTMDLDDTQRRYIIRPIHRTAIDIYRRFKNDNPTDLRLGYTDNPDIFQQGRAMILALLPTFLCDTDSSEDVAGAEEDSQDIEKTILANCRLNEAGEVHPVVAFTILCSVSPGEVLARPAEATRLVAALQWIARITLWGACLRDSRRDNEPLLDLVKARAGDYLREIRGTVFSWLRGVMHVGTHFVNDRPPIGRFVYAGDHKFLVDGQTIPTQAWKDMVLKRIQTLQTTFDDLCTYTGLTEADLTLPDKVRDQVQNQEVGYGVVTDEKNGFKDRNTLLWERFALVFYRDSDDGPQEIPGAWFNYVKLLRSFLLALQAALYFSGGQPPRGENDLWAMQYTNTEHHGRNLFFYDGTMVYVSNVHKNGWRYGKDGGVPHIFPWPNPGRLLLLYISIFRTLERWYASINPQRFDVTVRSRLDTYVFQCMDRHLGTDEFTSYMKRVTLVELELPFEGLGIADLRQISKYVSARYLIPSLNDPDQALQATMDLQGGHSSAIAESHYGVELEQLPASMHSNTYINFKVVSFMHHQYYRLQDHSTFLRLMGVKGLPSASDPVLPPANLVIDQQVVLATPRKGRTTVTVPATPLANKLMEALAPMLVSTVQRAPRDIRNFHSVVTNLPKDLLSSLVRMRMVPLRSVTQAEAMVTVHSRKEDLLCVLPTGGGKSLIFQAPAAATTGNRIVVVILPFVTLAHDQIKSARKLGLEARLFDGEGVPASDCPDIVFVVAETAILKSFLLYLREIESRRTLLAIVLDECHLFLSPELCDFRPAFRKLPSLFREFQAPIVCLTGSLPPQDEPKLLGLLNRDNFRTIRAPCRRPNISYRVDKTIIPWDQFNEVKEYIWRVSKSVVEKRGRVLVFMPKKALITGVAKIALTQGDECLYVTADIPQDQQRNTLRAWGTSPNNCILLATGVLGTGVDLDAVRLVLHVGLPPSFRDWFQQSGRAGRDGKPAVSIINITLPPFRPKISQEDISDGTVMSELAASDTCRRIVIEGYMDGVASACLASAAEACDVCMGEVEKALGGQDLRQSITSDTGYLAPRSLRREESASDALYWASVGEIEPDDIPQSPHGRQRSASADTLPYASPFMAGSLHTRGKGSLDSATLSSSAVGSSGSLPRKSHASLGEAWQTPTGTKPRNASHSHRNGRSSSDQESQTPKQQIYRFRTPTNATRGAFPPASGIQQRSRIAETRLRDVLSEQKGYMTALGTIKCVFCMLLYGEGSDDHVTEECHNGMQYSPNTPSQSFRTLLQTWGRVMPFSNRGVQFCPYCRFPKDKGAFHSEENTYNGNNRAGCHFQDTLNRAAWLMKYHPDFWRRTKMFSLGTLTDGTSDDEFKSWLMLGPENGINNLFRMFKELVNRHLEPR